MKKRGSLLPLSLYLLFLILLSAMVACKPSGEPFPSDSSQTIGIVEPAPGQAPAPQPAPAPPPAPQPEPQPAPTPEPTPQPTPIAPTTIRVSIDSAGLEGNSLSDELGNHAISADGRFVAFSSVASNLVPDDTNGARDVFLHDTLNRTTKRISLDSAGSQGNNHSFSPSMSADGRFIVFTSSASNLVPGDTNGSSDIFLRDTLNQTTTRVSIDSSGNQSNSFSGSDEPFISADGRFVAFSSTATNLVSGDTNARSDIFLHERLTRATTRVSLNSSGNQSDNNSVSPSLSSDGRFIAFSSSGSNLVPGDTNGNADIFLHDRLNRTTTRVSVNSNGDQGNFSSFFPTLSSDGRFVAFASTASNLVPGDTNGFSDIFHHDTLNRTTIRVSVDSAGNQGKFISDKPSISADGRFVAFQTDSPNLVSGDTNAAGDIFLHDISTRTTARVSVNSDGNQSNSNSFSPSLSSDGRFVVFASFASNLVSDDTNGVIDIFLHRQ